MISPETSLERLKAGNRRFVKAGGSIKDKLARRVKTARGQNPFAIVVGCSDSRTTPEIVFDQNIGDLFVIRTAGNLADDFALGSIEFAVQQLGVRLIVVMGHSRCGAVAAAQAGDSAPGHIGELVKAIRPAVEKVHAEKEDELPEAIKSNMAEVAAHIRENAELGQLKESVRVVQGYYELDTGKVSWVEN